MKMATNKKWLYIYSWHAFIQCCIHNRPSSYIITQAHNVMQSLHPSVSHLRTEDSFHRRMTHSIQRWRNPQQRSIIKNSSPNCCHSM